MYVAMRTRLLVAVGLVVMTPLLVRAPQHEAGSPLSDELRSGLRAGPPLTLWAWERPEDLRFLQATGIAVAPLIATVTLHADDFRVAPRRQPLALPPDTPVTAVVRVELDASRPPVLSRDQASRVAQTMIALASAEKFTTLQVDFDAPVSARPFYRQLLSDLRAALPKETRLSMTALASWCLGDPWVGKLPVQEIVPMTFRMGADATKVRQHLASGQEFHVACRFALGVSTDEPLPRALSRRRLYVFPTASWTADDVRSLARTVGVSVP